MTDAAEAYRELQSRGGIADLSNRVKLVVRGADRIRYLNGQVTSNVAQLAVGQTQSACVTTAKGKLCAEVMITAQRDSLLVDAEGDLADSLQARLERYIVADDVAVEAAPTDTCLLHVLGREPTAMAALGTSTFHQARRFGVAGWDWWTNTATAAQFGPELASHFLVLDEPLLESIRVERGIPRWGYELDENTLPPEAGLDQTHVDYQKGCYIGQEVISRLKSVGHVNRHLTGFVAENNEPLTAPSPVVTVDEPDKQVGELTTAVWSFALEKYVALGYLKRGAPARGLVSRPIDGRAAEAAVNAQALPFVS